MPVIIIGGIWTGFFTPSESAAIAVVYGLVVSLFYLQVVATEPWMFLLWFNICLLLLGIFIEPLPAMLLSAPLFLPLAPW